MEAEATFLLFDDRPDCEELCYCTLDLAALAADMAQVTVEATIETSPAQRLGSFCVSVQATAAVQRARRALGAQQ